MISIRLLRLTLPTFAAILIQPFLSGTAGAASIQWTGMATVSYGDGDSFETAPALNPILSTNAPGNFTGVITGLPGVNWTVSLSGSTFGQSIRLSVMANPMAVSATAQLTGVAIEQHKVIRIDAQYSVAADLFPVTIALQTNAAVNVSGATINTLATHDEIHARASIDIAESSTVDGADLFENAMIRELHKIDGVNVPVETQNLESSQFGNKPSGLYDVQIEIDLAALAIGNPMEERASALWSSAVVLNYFTIQPIGTVPEPATGLLAIIGTGFVFLRRYRRQPPQSAPDNESGF